MTRTFIQQIDELNRLLHKMASLAEEQVHKSIEALVRQDVSGAHFVILKDKRVDFHELEIDNYIFNFLALQQPVATDLRFVLAAQKITNDLERISDHAVNIAEAAIALADAPHIKKLVNIPLMAEKVVGMLKRAIDSFVNKDASLAATVQPCDDEVDALHQRVKEILFVIVKERPEHFDRAVHLLAVSNNLERIGDLATNIAEEVIFVIEAKVAKHEENLDDSSL